MKCPVCVVDGRTSRVTSKGVARTLLGWSPYYDEAGIKHNHDPNRNREGLICSNGHVFMREFHRPCPVGDYPAADDEHIVVR